MLDNVTLQLYISSTTPLVYFFFIVFASKLDAFPCEFNSHLILQIRSFFPLSINTYYLDTKECRVDHRVAWTRTDIVLPGQKKASARQIATTCFSSARNPAKHAESITNEPGLAIIRIIRRQPTTHARNPFFSLDMVE